MVFSLALSASFMSVRMSCIRSFFSLSRKNASPLFLRYSGVYEIEINLLPLPREEPAAASSSSSLSFVSLYAPGLTLAAAAFLFVLFATGFGLFASSFTRSQIAAMFVTMMGTMIPAIQFAGMMNPVSSLEGFGALVGRIYPASHFLTISRGVFNKALGFSSLHGSFWPLLLAGPVILGISILLLKKQEA